MLKLLLDLFHQHPYGASIVSTWLFNNVISVMIGSLPAPTKDSSVKYVYWFKVANTIIGNVKRAQSTALENSPNWKDAVEKHLESQQNGSPKP